MSVAGAIYKKITVAPQAVKDDQAKFATAEAQLAGDPMSLEYANSQNSPKPNAGSSELRTAGFFAAVTKSSSASTDELPDKAAGKAISVPPSADIKSNACCIIS